MTQSVIEQFQALFMKWNSSINLSAARTLDEVREHVEDSLAIVPHLANARRVLDVGSGGGFPVVLAALSCRETEFVSLEPVHKKHAFLRTAARELKLANLTCIAARIEDHEDHDYDVAMSRATFDLREWIEQALPFVKVGGRVLGFEGVERTDLPFKLDRHPYDLRGKQRAIVVVKRAS
jgi:16S rRNA (guanine527-N7)-methyltransferase